MMALFTTNRYWGEGGVQPSPAPLALQQLHQLAQQRKLQRSVEGKGWLDDSQKRSNRAATEGEGQTSPTESYSKKTPSRNKKSVVHTPHSSVTLDGTGTGGATAAAGGQLVAAAVTLTDKRKRKRLRANTGRDHSSERDEEFGGSAIGEEVLAETESSQQPSMKRRKRTKKRVGTLGGNTDLGPMVSEAAVVNSKPTKRKKKKRVMSDEGVEGRTKGEDGDGVEGHTKREEEDGVEEEPDAMESPSEEAEAIENVSDEAAVESDRDGTLAPITRTAQAKRHTSVHRQLPEWVLHPQLIETDIRGHSLPLGGCDLPGVVVHNLQRMGYTSLFPVQASVIPELLSSLHGPLLTPPPGHAPRDICVCAPTGCGKTLCYVVPIVCALLHRVVCQIRALVTVPSQELALQVYRVFQKVVHGTGIRIGMISGQEPMEKESLLLLDSSSYPPGSTVDVVIATPGRLADHLKTSSFATLRCLRFLVLDEADKLLDQEFQEWLPRLLETVSCEKPAALLGGGKETLASVLLEQCCVPVTLRLMASRPQEPDVGTMSPGATSSTHPLQVGTMSPGATSSTHPLQSDTVSHRTTAARVLQPHPPLQKLLFSATMTLDPEHLSALTLHKPKLFSVAATSKGREGVSFVLPPQLEEHEVHCPLSHKPLVLLHLLTSLHLSRVLCFTNSRKATHRLCLLLQQFNTVSVAELSGGLSHGQRRTMLQRFRVGKVKVLVCSDAMARGMDVEGVEGVVNYEPPTRFKTYLHRVGRTARAGQRGVAYTLLAHEEVAAFHTMLRKAGRARLTVERVETEALQPLLAEYEAALGSLREHVRAEHTRQ